MTNSNHVLWVEKYRPSTIDSVVLPDSIKSVLKSIKEKNELLNLLFYGPPGSGKTTVALALANEMDCEVLFLNGSLGSDESGIEAFRTKVRLFASSVSLNGGRKVVIIDEADYLNQTVQPALRGLIEEFAKNCSFILTCNYLNRVIPPVVSRFSLVDFSIKKDDKPLIAAHFQKRVSYILKQEGIEVEDNKILGSFVLKYFPDLRKTINELQIYSLKNRKIDVGALSESNTGYNIEELLLYVKRKDYDKAHKWVYDNLDGDLRSVLESIYDGLFKYFKPNVIPHVVLAIEDSLFRSRTVDDQEISLMAFISQLMVLDAIK